MVSIKIDGVEYSACTVVELQEMVEWYLGIDRFAINVNTESDPIDCTEIDYIKLACQLISYAKYVGEEHEFTRIYNKEKQGCSFAVGGGGVLVGDKMSLHEIEIESLLKAMRIQIENKK